MTIVADLSILLKQNQRVWLVVPVGIVPFIYRVLNSQQLNFNKKI